MTTDHHFDNDSIKYKKKLSSSSQCTKWKWVSLSDKRPSPLFFNVTFNKENEKNMEKIGEREEAKKQLESNQSWQLVKTLIIHDDIYWPYTTL